MKATNFIQKTSEALKEFFAQEFKMDSELSPAEIRLGMPGADKVSDDQLQTRAGVFSFFHSHKAQTVYLLPYATYRVQANRSPLRQSEEVMQADGTRISVSRRPAEPYRIRYMIFGPSLATESGQNLLTSFISILFDYPRITVSVDGQEEELKLFEVLTPEAGLAHETLHRRGIKNEPLYLFDVELNIATDRVIAKDRLVRSRVISVNRLKENNET